ncbi:carotene isomerase, partial [Haematococcus lacustris]
MALTSARFMGPEMLQMGLVASQLTGSFGAVVDRVVTNPWLRSFLDLECFVLSGMTARSATAGALPSSTRWEGRREGNEEGPGEMRCRLNGMSYADLAQGL